MSPCDRGDELYHNLRCFCSRLCLLPAFVMPFCCLVGVCTGQGFSMLFHVQVMILVLGAEERRKQLRMVGVLVVVVLFLTANTNFFLRVTLASQECVKLKVSWSFVLY